MSDSQSSEPDHQHLLLHRTRWLRALLTQPKAEIIAVAEQFAETYNATHLEPPQAGLALMRLQDSVLGDTFNLGEIPLSTAQVELKLPSGEVHRGSASLMIDDSALATAAAICEVVLRARMDGWLTVARFIHQGLAQLDRDAAIRHSIAKRSQVDFALLSQDS